MVTFPQGGLVWSGIISVVSLLTSVKARGDWIRMQWNAEFYFLQEQFLEFTEALKIK